MRATPRCREPDYTYRLRPHLRVARIPALRRAEYRQNYVEVTQVNKTVFWLWFQCRHLLKTTSRSRIIELSRLEGSPDVTTGTRSQSSTRTTRPEPGRSCPPRRLF